MTCYFRAVHDVSRRGTHWVFGSACWEADRCDREKSIWNVTTGPDLLDVCLVLILTRVRAPRGAGFISANSADGANRQAWPI